MIQKYSFGSITVDGETYTSDVIVYRDRVQDKWLRNQGHSLCTEDITDILALKPDFLVVGCGRDGIMKVSDEIRKELEGDGIVLKSAPTDAAVAEYNKLVEEGKNVVGAFHLTC